MPAAALLTHIVKVYINVVFNNIFVNTPPLPHDIFYIYIRDSHYPISLYMQAIHVSTSAASVFCQIMFRTVHSLTNPHAAMQVNPHILF
jgi:hypothetical protein